MSEFVAVAKVTDIPDPGKQTLEVRERVVVLLHVDGKFYCIDDVCTHDGGPLGDGSLDDHQISCPRHGAKFDIRNGKALTMPATIDTITHEVKIEGDTVWVKVHES
jgi:3-phenylpropionate/trans-cinnamate dioxygenase ferredoxin subunit